MRVGAKASSQPIQEEPPKWGLTTYRVRFVLLNTFRCSDDLPTTDLDEAKRRAEEVARFPGVSALRITAERDLPI